MKIGFFSEVYYPKTDGVVISIETFRRALEAQGHEVYIFVPAPSLRYKESDPRVIRFPAIQGLWFEDYMTKFPWTPQNYKAARDLKLDVIHIHTPSELGIFGMSVALKQNIPIVYTYHTDLYAYVKHYRQVLPGALVLSQLLPLLIGKTEMYRQAISVIRPESSVDRWNQKIVRTMLPLQMNLCDAVIAPSLKIEKQLKSWKVKAPLTILPTGVDPVPTDDDAVAEFRQRFQIEPSDRVILFVGRMAAEKNVELLIRAFNHTVEKVPEAKLVLVGDDAYRPNLVKLAAKLPAKDRVVFTGYITDRRELGAAYAASSLFVFPSTTDTQGLAVHEAACAGLPIVMVDPEITDVVQDGRNGFFATPNITDLSHKMTQILSDDRLRLGMADISRGLAKDFSASEQARKLLSLYQQVIRDHHKLEPQGHTKAAS